MSSSDIAVSVRGLSKSYTIAHNQEKHSTLAETVLHKLKNPFKRVERETFWALKDVSFDIKKGDVVGIIGRNGAGKSTLLKILSRITEPTSGEVRLQGRVGSLLEVGTGFHPELTGRENIFLNGAILGMTKAEIRKHFDEIIDFAEIEKFLDTPVKRYSSGMYVRLAFAVAAHLNPEILIVDEVLSVGDGQFQTKCLGKMKEVSSGQGRTVLFVSHNMVAVQSLCQKALFLRGGRLLSSGPTGPLVTEYLRSVHHTDRVRTWKNVGHAPGIDALRIARVRIHDGRPSDDSLLQIQNPLHIDTDLCIFDPSMQLHITYHLVNDQGIVVLTTACRSQRRPAGKYTASFSIPANLLNTGGYSLKLFVVHNDNQVMHEAEGIASFNLVDGNARPNAYHGREPGVIQPLLPWDVSSAVDRELDEPQNLLMT